MGAYAARLPLTFEDGRFQLLWRNEVRGSKCGLLGEGEEPAVARPGAAEIGATLPPGAGTVTGYVWFYTYAAF